jgi:hypothetical protein
MNACVGVACAPEDDESVAAVGVSEDEPAVAAESEGSAPFWWATLETEKRFRRCGSEPGAMRAAARFAASAAALCVCGVDTVAGASSCGRVGSCCVGFWEDVLA